jgi:hypothetical protein
MSAFRRLSAHRPNLAMGAVMETSYVRMGLTLLASMVLPPRNPNATPY